MNGYVCFYESKRTEVHASTSREAQIKAAEFFKVKPKDVYKVNVWLAELNGVQCSNMID